MDIFPKRFTIDSTLELPADHYTAEIADSVVQVAAPSPASVPNMLAWYDASSESYANGVLVDTLHDRSGNGNDATQSADARKPTFKTFASNGKPSLTFDGNRVLILPAGLDVDGDLSIFIVGKITSFVSNPFLITSQRGGDYGYAFWILNPTGKLRFRSGPDNIDIESADGITAGAFQCYDVVRSVLNITIQNNQIAEANGNLPNPPTGVHTAIVLGGLNGAPDNGVNGEITEVIIFSRALTAAERLLVEQYLARKYDLPGSHGVGATTTNTYLSAPARNSGVLPVVTIQAGLLDANNNPVIITALANGTIDEYELTYTPTAIITRIRGRDRAALILDSFFVKQYQRASTQLGLPSFQPGDSSVQSFAGRTPQVGNLQFEVGSDSSHPYVVESLRDPQAIALQLLLTGPTVIGNFKASQIAAEAVQSVGLTLHWNVRDYEILEPTYQVNGRIIDTLRRLVSPWSLVEPFKVDILLQGSTVIIQHRTLPQQGALDASMIASLSNDVRGNIPVTTSAPLYSFDLTAARLTSTTARKRPLKKIGLVHLTGANKPKGLAFNSSTGAGGAGVFSSGSETIDIESDSFNGGQQTSKMAEHLTYRMPDRLLTKHIKEEFAYDSGGASLKSRETSTKDYEPSLYDANGPITSPKLLNDTVIREGFLDADFIVLGEDSIDYEYDHTGFLTTQTTLKKVVDQDDINNLLNSELSIETTNDIAALMAEKIVSTYDWDNDAKQWVIRSRKSSVAGGHRPGGPGRGTSHAGQGSGAGSTANPLTLLQTFSTDPDSQPVTYSNPNMSAADLAFIMALFAASVNLYEIEFSFNGLAMPWLKRGIVVQFVNVFAEDGVTLLPFPPMLVTEVNTSYDESQANAQYTMRSRAFGYSL